MNLGTEIGNSLENYIGYLSRNMLPWNELGTETTPIIPQGAASLSI